MAAAAWPAHVRRGEVTSLALGPGVGVGGASTPHSLVLLEVSEAQLEELQQGRCHLKGSLAAGGDAAVLCTDDRTYALRQVETSNTLLLVPPGGEAGRAAGDPASPGVTQSGAEAVVKAVDGGREPGLLTQNAALAAKDGGLRIEACASASATLELAEVPPDLSPLAALLKPYGAADEDRDPAAPPLGRTFDELLARVKASPAQLRAGLQAAGAVELEDGTWRTVDPVYERRLLDMVLLTAGAGGWPLDAIPELECVDSLVGDGFPRALAMHALRTFGKKGDGSPLLALDARRVCVTRAAQLLDENGGRWRLAEFMSAWRGACPDDLEPDADFLRGEALVEGSGKEAWVRPYREASLPSVPAERFKLLFALRPKWLWKDMQPYVEGLQVPGSTTDMLLMKHTRRVQERAGADVYFTARY